MDNKNDPELLDISNGKFGRLHRKITRWLTFQFENYFLIEIWWIRTKKNSVAPFIHERVMSLSFSFDKGVKSSASPKKSSLKPVRSNLTPTAPISVATPVVIELPPAERVSILKEEGNTLAEAGTSLFAHFYTKIPY